MKCIRNFCWGVLFGFVTACVILLAPATGPQWAAGAWSVEEIAFNRLALLLPSVFAPGTTTGMLSAMAFHFAFWLLLGGLIFWGIAMLRAKRLHET